MRQTRILAFVSNILLLKANPVRIRRADAGDFGRPVLGPGRKVGLAHKVSQRGWYLSIARLDAVGPARTDWGWRRKRHGLLLGKLSSC
jgi:hypothetical protein